MTQCNIACISSFCSSIYGINNPHTLPLAHKRVSKCCVTSVKKALRLKKARDIKCILSVTGTLDLAIRKSKFADWTFWKKKIQKASKILIWYSLFSNAFFPICWLAFKFCNLGGCGKIDFSEVFFCWPLERAFLGSIFV